jgi:hypothetical protein
MMVSIEETVWIDQAASVITAALMDPENMVYWTSDLERFEVIAGEPGKVGARALLHYVQGDQTYTMEDELLEMVPNEYFLSRVSGGGLVAQVETWLKEADRGTNMTIRWEGTGENWRLKLLLPFMRGPISRQTRKDLEKFKQLIEDHGVHFSK